MSKQHMSPSSGNHGANNSEDRLSAAVHFLGTDENPEINMEEALKAFWDEEYSRVLNMNPGGDDDFKSQNDLPLARIKRIMKSDEDVRMISAEAPVLFAKACELFILELTIRSYCYTKEERGKRRILTREDVCQACQQTPVFDFLVGVLTPGAKPQYLIDAEESVEMQDNTTEDTSGVRGKGRVASRFAPYN